MAQLRIWMSMEEGCRKWWRGVWNIKRHGTKKWCRL